MPLPLPYSASVQLLGNILAVAERRPGPEALELVASGRQRDAGNAYMTPSCLGASCTWPAPWCPAPRRLVATLRVLPPRIDKVGVRLLAEHARHQLHPAT